MLEVLQRLRKIDPDSLVLNFSECDNPDLASGSDSGSDSSVTQNDDALIQQYDKNRKDLFIYSAYIPPGKHCIIVRDTGTKRYKKHEIDAEYEELNSPEVLSPTAHQLAGGFGDNVHEEHN